MKYMLLIHQGSTPTPRDPEAWGRLSQEEQADDLDAAIELAARIPAARLGGAIEVRPIVEY
jgi:hypothetical protein